MYFFKDYLQEPIFKPRQSKTDGKKGEVMHLSSH